MQIFDSGDFYHGGSDSTEMGEIFSPCPTCLCGESFAGMLTDVKVRDFRCFDALECSFPPGLTAIVGHNAQGKTSLLEAACILVRLQSPRASLLSRVIRHEQRGFLVDGHFAGRHLQFYYGRTRKKLALDSLEQHDAHEYLAVGKAVWFANSDLELVRGSGDIRRRFLDFAAMQWHPAYRQHWREYEKALRSRNALLKRVPLRWSEIEAWESPLVEHGVVLSGLRRDLVQALLPHAVRAHAGISQGSESLVLEYAAAATENFAAALHAARGEDARLRQTTVGPHRDDVLLGIGGEGAEFASEGQQRTIAISLKMALAHLLNTIHGRPPLLLIDDVFGELDPDRRNALFSQLPDGAQRIITTTHLDWLEGVTPEAVFTMEAGNLRS